MASWRDTIKEEKPSWRDTIKEDDSSIMDYELPYEIGTPGGIVRETVKNLPVVGSVIGGGLGLASPFPGGAFGGSVVGAGLGRSLQEVIEQKAYGKQPISEPEMIKEIGLAGAEASIGETVGPLLSKAGSLASKGIKNVSSSFSKIPKKVMETYSERGPEVSKIGNDIIEAADDLRTQGQKAIESFKSLQNSKISNAIDAKKNEIVSSIPIKNAIEENIKKLDPIINADQVKKLQSELDLINHISGKDGDITAQQGYALQKRLQDLAEYLEPGQIFKKKNFVDLTFAKAASRARQQINRVVPEISEANRELAKIRRIDKNINKNLISPEKSINALMGAGTGENQQTIKQLKKLEDVVGFPYLRKTEELAAANYFNDAGLLPKEKTVSAMAPLILSGIGGIGGAISEGDIGGITKGLALGALASPLAIKGAINVANKTPDFVKQNIMQSIQRAVQMGMPAHLIDEQVKKSDLLKPTEKAEMRRNLVK